MAEDGIMGVAGRQKNPRVPHLVTRTFKAVFRSGLQLFSAIRSCGGRAWSSSGTKWSVLRLKSYSKCFYCSKGGGG